ncbi:barstar family protein [Dactylosporangium sp. NBC_01737]|uniref:barstar family protein n=1 Tax=Dactylosporangium sp. NBC_01737 TaxID=2975959 RepID=UPI002E109ED1|nr:barstar family protein [Dactylosporangium sp. NBC_01737]
MTLRRRRDQPVPLRWLLIDEYTMGEPDTAVAACTDIDGLFSWPAPQPATLLGCRPEPKLRAAIEALRRGAGNPGGALHRRRIDGLICSVDTGGRVTPTFASLQGSVAGARPSALGEGLLDVTFDTGVTRPMPPGARDIWERRRTEGRPAEPGLWHRYDQELRHQWLGAALAHRRRDAPDRPAGTTYHLDGGHVTDIDGFYCAIGEAVNGPGGYFGWNLDALDDCLRGGWGATSPFRLVWHDAHVARAHLTGLDQVMAVFAEHHVEVEPR